MRAVLDTNVIVSGALSEGKTPPGAILDASRTGQFQLVTSDALIAELRRVIALPKIAGPLGWSVQDCDDFVASVVDDAELVEPTVTIDLITDDPADNRVLEAAIAGAVDYIVSGDTKHLLPLGNYEGIPIVRPAQFVVVLAVG